MATKSARKISPAKRAKIREQVGDLASALERVYELSDPATLSAESTELELEIKQVQKKLTGEVFACHIPFLCDLSPKPPMRRSPKKKAR